MMLQKNIFKTLLVTGSLVGGLTALDFPPALSIDISTSAINIGNITNGQTVNETLTSGGIDSYSFTINDPFTYLDITTNGTTGFRDTVIGLYDASGNLVANDNDNGIERRSTLSFGTGSGQTLGTVADLGGDGIANGENGALSVGTYFLALGEFPTTFNSTGFYVTTTGTDSGAYQIEFFTDSTPVPFEPSPTLGLLLLGAGVGLKRGRDYWQAKTKKIDLS